MDDFFWSAIRGYGPDGVWIKRSEAEKYILTLEADLSCSDTSLTYARNKRYKAEAERDELLAQLAAVREVADQCLYDSHSEIVGRVCRIRRILETLSATTGQNEGENEYIDIVFDGPPSHESGRFIEVENSYRRSINFGEWVDRGDYWALRIPDYRNFIAERDKLRARLEAGITLINKRMEDGCLCRKCGPEIRAALSGVTPEKEKP